jgi:hypothetical protein
LKQYNDVITPDDQLEASLISDKEKTINSENKSQGDHENTEFRLGPLQADIEK